MRLAARPQASSDSRYAGPSRGRERRKLDLREDHGQGRSQLVRRVGREPRLLLERPPKPFEHGVNQDAQPAELGIDAFEVEPP